MKKKIIIQKIESIVDTNENLELSLNMIKGGHMLASIVCDTGYDGDITCATGYINPD